MKIRKISETEMIVTKSAWQKRLVGLVLASVLFFLPLIYKVTVDYLPEEAKGYSVVTAGLLGLIGVGLFLFSHTVKIRLQKGGAVEIGRRSLLGRTKKEVLSVDAILSLQVVRGSSTSLAFIMKDNSPAVRFLSQDNRNFLGLGGGSDLSQESQQIAEFLNIPLHSKGSVQNIDLASQSIGIATEVLRPDTVKIRADMEDEWEEQRLGKNSAHQELANREIRKDIMSSIANDISPSPTTNNQPISNTPSITGNQSTSNKEKVIDIIERGIESPPRT